MSRTKKVVRAVVLAAVLTAPTACGAAAQAPKAQAPKAQPTAPVKSSAPVTSTAAAAPVQAVYDPGKAPKLDGPGKVLLQAAGRTGGEQFPVVPHVAAGTMTFDVVCVGPGKLTVDVHGLVSFTVDCHAADPAEHDEYVQDQARSDVGVSVTDTGGDRWAFTFGWNPSTATPK